MAYLREYLAQLVVAVSIAAGSASCLASTINISLDTDPGKLDPAQSSMFAERMVYQSVFDKLLDLDENGRIVPMLALRWSVSADRKTYTLYLRQGVKFQDGTVFNAQAVAFNLQRGQEKSSLRKNDLKYIKQISVVDDATLKIELFAPFSPFLSVLTDRAGMMSSPEAVRKFGSDYVNHPVGTGPFIYRGRMKGVSLTLDKNPNYWQTGLPKVDHLVYKIMPDVNVAFNNLRAGQVDITNRFPYKGLKNVGADDTYYIINKPSFGFHGIYFNTSKPPFDRREVRQAIDILINRRAIAKVAYNGAVSPAHSPFSRAQFAYGPEDDPSDVDLVRAKSLLKAAGREAGFSFRLSMSTAADELQVGQMLQAMLRPAGITVELERLEQAIMIEVGRAGKFEALTEVWSGRPDPDQNIYDFVVTGGALNYSRYGVPEVDALLQRARIESDEMARKTLYDQTMQILTADVPYVYLNHDNVVFGISKAIKGFKFVPDGVIRTASLDR